MAQNRKIDRQRKSVEFVANFKFDFLEHIYFHWTATKKTRVHCVHILCEIVTNFFSVPVSFFLHERFIGLEVSEKGKPSMTLLGLIFSDIFRTVILEQSIIYFNAIDSLKLLEYKFLGWEIGNWIIKVRPRLFDWNTRKGLIKLEKI